MRFPSITHYIESVANLSQRLRTLTGINPILDRAGEPLFYSSRGVTTFSVERDGQLVSLRCFTSVAGYERTLGLIKASIIAGEIYENELFVFDDNYAGDYYTVMVEEQARTITRSEASGTEFYEGLIPYEEGGLWGYRTEDQQIVIKVEYDSVGEFGEGRAVVGKCGLYGLIDRDGTPVLDMIYDEISWDGSAIAYVERGGKWGCFDRSARQIVQCSYDWMGEYSSSLLLVRKADKYGYLDLLGREAIPLVYDSATSFDENGLALVRISGQSVMINTQGEIER